VYECAYNALVRGFSPEPSPCSRTTSPLTIRDELTAVDKQRYVTLGRDVRGRLLVVAYTWREGRIRL